MIVHMMSFVAVADFHLATLFGIMMRLSSKNRVSRLRFDAERTLKQIDWFVFVAEYAAL